MICDVSSERMMNKFKKINSHALASLSIDVKEPLNQLKISNENIKSSMQ